MTTAQAQVLVILAATVGMFLWGRWRHDMVALGSLLACVAAGLVPTGNAFAGFGHPAVITVACVLVLSRGLYVSGAVDIITERALPTSAGPMATIAALAGLGAALSAFMNNVGAMALLMPVAVQLASKHDLPPGKFLMPLSFGTILGGMTTLIGTPPNLIVSGFRAETAAGSFSMFDFTPVGLAVAIGGITLLVLVGTRLVPAREGAGTDSFDTGKYFTEARVTEGSKAEGETLRAVEEALEESDAQVVGMVRNDFRIAAPNPRRVVRAGDILVIEAEPESMASALSRLGLKLEEDVPRQSQDADHRADEDEDEDEDDDREETGAAETILQELVPMSDSPLVGRSASDIQLRTRHGLNLLAVSRRGRRSVKRLRSVAIQAGDVLLMQGPPEGLAAFASEFACVPLAGRLIRVPETRQALIAAAVMAAAIGGAAFGLLPAAVSFAGGVLVLMAMKVLPLQKVYEAVDWPVIVLLGALFPVAGAMASTGAADLVAGALLREVAQGHAILALAVILIVTMTLSDFMNNAATAAVMCPIAISTAGQLGANADAFLMAVAIGASCAFLTPIGHQNNTLIMGPGGFRFRDYWRLGLPMEIVVVAVAVPLLTVVWPL
jgi:di/tricarboxylate transporter